MKTHRVVRAAWLSGALLLALGACSSDTAPPNELAANSTAAVTARLPAPEQTIDPRRAAAMTPVATTVRVAAAAVADGQRFRIGQTVRSDQPALENVALTLRSTTRSSNQLTLEVAFENMSGKRFTAQGLNPAAMATLVDAAGKQYSPVRSSAELSSISPAGGFAPGGANVGTITFPQPAGPGPYELRLPGYPAIRFRLDTPVSSTPVPEVPSGTYTVETTLRSPDGALEPIALDVRSVELGHERLTFHLALINTSRQGYSVSGVQGNAAWLLGGEGRQYEPVDVSKTLQGSITPAGSWQPGEAITGTIAFPRPQSLDRVRFVFPSYNALTLRFDGSGLAGVEITSPAGGAPAPVPTAAPDEQAFLGLNRLLERLAEAVRAGASDDYLSAFAPGARAEQQTMLGRLQRVPLANYRLSLAPSADLSGAADGTLENVPIDVRYTFRGIPADNEFLSSLRFDFKRVHGSWQVTNVRAGAQPPFWRIGDIATAESEHFLIFTRPEMAGQLPEIKQEAEAAYRRLAARGLPLDERYVTFVTAGAADFRRLTGQSDGVIGTALWRYRAGSDGFQVLSRAFYVNGAAFAEGQDRRPAGERQTTIAHELVHLALAAETRPFTPAWLKEGIAVYYADQQPDAERRRLVESGALDRLTLEELTRARSLVDHGLGGEQVSYAYTFSGAAVAYLAEHYSEAKTLEFFRSYADVPLSQTPGKLSEAGMSSEERPPEMADLSVKQTNEALQHNFGITLSQLDMQVKQWLRSRYG
jgi:hypothetical protein